jgi:hypothetical protein
MRMSSVLQQIRYLSRPMYTRIQIKIYILVFGIEVDSKQLYCKKVIFTKLFPIVKSVRAKEVFSSFQRAS